MVGLGNAWSGVRDAEVQAAVPVARVVEPDADLHLALLGVLDGVREQVAQHLAQPQHVADDHARHGRFDAADHLQLLALGAARIQLARLFGQVAHVEGFAHEFHLAGLDLRVVEDVVDDLHHRLGGRAHRVDEAALPLVQVGAGQQFGHA
jgi:hypothetical protein